MRRLYFLLVFFSFISVFNTTLFAQSVLDPNDPVVTYNSSNPPKQPASGVIGKWVRTKRLSWNTDEYKAYILNGAAFRLKFPKTYDPTAADGKKYPMLIFFHGLGETGSIYDNEYQLYHGGEDFAKNVDNGTFDGYVLCMQSTGVWTSSYYKIMKLIIDYMAINNKLDIFRVYDNGLSAGGKGTWSFMIAYPTYITAGLPMSAVDLDYVDATRLPKILYKPIWNFQGALDSDPSPVTGRKVRDVMADAGANYRYTEYPDLGHGTWDRAWSEPDFYPFINRAYQSNPWPVGGRTEFCKGDVIKVKMGLTPGFNAYQWRRNGSLIKDSVSNTFTATDIGVYTARVKKGKVWSAWSPIPVEIKYKAPTITPPIQVSGLMSSVLPAADGTNFVNLEVPDNGYVKYTWKRVGNDNVISNQRILKVTKPAGYIVSVTEQFGCSSNYSDPFYVVDANGANGPAPALNLIAYVLNKTQIELDWSKNSNAVNPATAYEIYRSTDNSSYSFVGKAPADSLSFVDKSLKPDIKYFYKVRAVNGNGAAPISNIVSAITQSDRTPPTPPANLRVAATTNTSISLAWDASTDDAGVSRYQIYVNGSLSYSTDQTNFTINNLKSGQLYSFYVKAKDVSGNYSNPSNQVSSPAVLQGLQYRYYEGNWSALPDFNQLTPIKTGRLSNIDISVRNRDDQFGFVWEGYIRIPVSGTYKFETYSDDGSKLWLSNYSASAVPLVNNDGLHSVQYQSGTVTLNAGIYPISAAFFEQGGDQVMQVYWTSVEAFGDNNRHLITDNYFTDNYTPDGVAPIAPNNIVANAVSYNRIDLSWKDNSSNETGFEIYRATNQNGPFNIVSTADANASSFSDTTLSASTTYYYKVQAINKYGGSGFDSTSSNAGFTQGLKYSYYQGAWSKLPDFNTLTPVKTGVVNNITLSPATSSTNYAFKFEGTINISTPGQYTFYTRSDDGSKLYIGSFSEANLVVNNDYSQGATERSGTITLNQGSYPFYVTYFQGGGGSALSASYQGPGLSKTAIPDNVLFYGTYTASKNYATTANLPAKPAKPVNPVASALSSSKISVTWTDAADNEINYQVLRSTLSSPNFKVIATLPANSSSYIDSSLIGNTTYNYKIAVNGSAGTSDTSGAISAKTNNDLPLITKIENRTAHYNKTTFIQLSASDIDNDHINFSISNNPAFAVLTDNGNNTATLKLTPTDANKGKYSNIKIIANDGSGGKDSTVFTLTVNANYDPVITAIPSYGVDENSSLTIPLTAIDKNSANVLTWSVSGLPFSYSLQTVSTRDASLIINPNYTSSGNYNITVNVKDGKGGFDTKEFTLTVNDKDPGQQIYVRFMDQDSIGTPWNSVTALSTSNLKDVNGLATTVDLQLQTNWWAVGHEGPQTGDNSGVYPDAVLHNYYYFGTGGAPQTITAKLTGLNTSAVYNLSFFAGSSSSSYPDNGTTIFSTESQSVSLYVQNNTSNTVSLKNIKPATDGSITFTMSKEDSSPAGYLNALVITSVLDDGMKPAIPQNLIAQSVSGSSVKLSWKDASYNETAYNIYRAKGAGNYTQIGETSANQTTYNDSTVTGFTQYYYRLKAVNTNGASDFSDSVGIITSDRIPSINNIDNIILKNNETKLISVSASDDNNDDIKLTAANLPSFVTFTDNGNGTGSISVSPSLNSIGYYPGIIITATDNSDSSRSTKFDITVVDKDVSSVYLNFSDGSIAPKPWNNLGDIPSAGKTYSVLFDDSNNPANISVTLTSGFEGINSYGMRPGNGKIIYPDAVVRTGLYETSTSTRTINISGLNPLKKYNFVFFNSHDDGTNGLTKFVINGQTVSLNATYNIDKTVQLNGISPDGNGQVNINITKDAQASSAYLSSLIIQSYDPAAFISPTDLRVTKVSRNSASLQWADRTASESGYEVWRANSSNGQFSKIAALSSNSTTFTDVNLSSNTTYYYTVRAVNGSITSNYSNVVSATTLAYAVYVNFTNTRQAGTPWNNLNTFPQEGYVWNNFVDETGATTNIGMQETSKFAGLYDAGMSTGNDSGIFPDNVMIESYGLFPGQTATMKITGLNMSMKYNFTFFASSQALGDVNTSFKVNGQTVLLNTSLNTSGTVTMYNIIPDDNGEVTIYIAPGTSTSQFGLIGAVIIQGFNFNNTNSVPQPPAFIQSIVNSGMRVTTLGNSIVSLSAYPNPFRTNLNAAVTSEKDDKARIMIYDMSGRMVYNNVFAVSKGINNLQLNTNGDLTLPGIYVMKVLFTNQKESKTVKIEKQR